MVEDDLAREASGLKMLSGASGDAAGTASATVQVKDAGLYHIWVRYSSHQKWRGAFHLTALAGDRVLGNGLFDHSFEGQSARDRMVWRSFGAELPEGPVTLRFSKHENKNSTGNSRMVDAVLLTMDLEAKPNHLDYGAQTFMRVTLREGYDKPAYVHLFTDHYHAPWYAHWSLGKAGAVAGIQVKKPEMLLSGEATPWCNITPAIYQDSGAMFYLTTRHSYTELAPRLRVRIDFATAEDEMSIVHSYEIDNAPDSVVIYLPPNLLSDENRALLKRDLEIAESIGKQADLHSWPTHGRKAKKFPLLVSANIDKAWSVFDQRVRQREEKTLSYFGFNEKPFSHIGGAWYMKDNSYCLPDLEKMQTRFQQEAESFRQAGAHVSDLLFCELTDEPTGQALELAATLPSYTEALRTWLKSKGLAPADLLVQNWDQVRIVTPAQRFDFPALYYWSQLFRTRALGDFMATQGRLAKEAYGGDFPILANFSDGAVYGANFFHQGVDYFELLDSPDQNAIWGEDWANLSSSYQCASFNVDLMRSAALARGQTIGHHLIAHAGRKPWDIKLKATSEVARGVRILNNFCYGPIWASHEGGPYFRTHLWQGKPETWTANASITREIGAAEDLLLSARPAPAQVALIYSSASDVWTVDETNAFGFDRMHTWMVLAHAQVPVDILSERQIESGALEKYRVAFLTGPNLTQASASKLKSWVQNGGILSLTAGAAMRDEYNRPLAVLNDLLPADRGDCVTLEKFQTSGRNLNRLKVQDTVTWATGKAEVLGAKQSLKPKANAEILATFDDGSPAVMRSDKVTMYGFLPALSYIKTALDRRKVAEEAKDPLIERSYNPWDFPAEIREMILAPAKNLERLVECSHALVDAVYLSGEKGIVIPLANYSLEPISELRLKISSSKKVTRVESAVHGTISFRQNDRVEMALPLEINDFVMLWFK